MLVSGTFPEKSNLLDFALSLAVGDEVGVEASEIGDRAATWRGSKAVICLLLVSFAC